MSIFISCTPLADGLIEMLTRVELDRFSEQLSPEPAPVNSRVIRRGSMSSPLLGDGFQLAERLALATIGAVEDFNLDPPIGAYSWARPARTGCGQRWPGGSGGVGGANALPDASRDLHCPRHQRRAMISTVFSSARRAAGSEPVWSSKEEGKGESGALEPGRLAMGPGSSTSGSMESEGLALDRLERAVGDGTDDSRPLRGEVFFLAESDDHDPFPFGRGEQTVTDDLKISEGVRRNRCRRAAR